MTNDEVLSYDPKTRQIICKGDWDLDSLPRLKQIVTTTATKIEKDGELTVNGQDIQKMDSAGAWFLNQLQHKLLKRGMNVKFANFSEKYAKLLELINREIQEEVELPKIKPEPWMTSFGRDCSFLVKEFLAYLAFVGMLTMDALRILRRPIHMRFNSLAVIIYNNGFQALPIIGLLSFMIGVVITYQMAIQLRNYGADVYIVDLLGLSVLREFGPLLTAIIVAGRTGSAFTAQLGIMKINEEIDALSTMGVTPAELLLLPRIIGLLIALPLLTMWANIFGVVGGMLMSYNMLHITWYDFLQRFSHVIPLKSLLIGLIKTPVFALLIASIGCFQGMQVENNANSLGKNTTRSVVLAIFFIIITDAVFSIIFSAMNL